MRRTVLFSALITLTVPLQAQDLVFSPGILDNNITNLGASGASIWVGPYLNVSHDGGNSWQAANLDSIRGFSNSVYSLRIRNQSIWAGLGTQYLRTGRDGETERVNETRGLVFSLDRGASWTFRAPDPPNDRDPATTGLIDLPDDSLIAYGSVMLPTLPITFKAQTPPWDLDYDAATETLWLAGQLSGIRRSTNQGRTWERVVLPPDTTAYLAPELGYKFPFLVQPIGIPEPLFHGLNFQAFSVLVDHQGTVWVGTAGGLNKSLDGGVRWTHYTTKEGLLGNWIISIEEQPRGSQPPAIWTTNWPGRGRNQIHGISVTRDGGNSFETALHGEKCYDFAFDGPRIYVACDRGLYRSNDDGKTFFVENQFIDRADPARSMRPDAHVYSVEITDHAVWVGSQDGLFRSTDQGDNWQIFRAEVPVDPTGLPPIIPADRVPRVPTYAYPNPFSPSSDRLIRIRFDLNKDQAILIRIFDYSMNLIRELRHASATTGANEVTWDGIDREGVRLANGTYFYAVLAQENTFWGKILIIE